MAFFRCSSGSGGSLTPTTLWTNTSPSADFGTNATNPISLSDDIRNYSYISVEYKSQKTDSNDSKISYLFTPTDFLSTASTTLRMGLLNTINSVGYSRGFKATSATTYNEITFLGAYKVNSGAGSNTPSYLIPLYVKGYK